MQKKKIEKQESTSSVDTQFPNQYMDAKEEERRAKLKDGQWNPEDDSWDDDYDEGGDDDNEE